MDKRTSPAARLAAVLALVVAAVAIVVVISSSSGGEDSDRNRNGSGGVTKQQQKKPRTKEKTYVVQSGDTLISIAGSTGVPVAEILALNPEVDPQILIAGQTLKLR
jgi:LysM repeat protein